MPKLIKRVNVPHDDPFTNVILPKVGALSRKDAALNPSPKLLRGRPPTWLAKATRAGRGGGWEAKLEGRAAAGGRSESTWKGSDRRRVMAKYRYFDKFARGGKHAKGLHSLNNYLNRLQEIEQTLDGGLHEGHGVYLTREGRFFSEKSEGLSVGDVTQVSAGDRRTGELTITPYDGRKLMTREFVRSYMREVEKATGTRLAWFAVIHKASHVATKDNLHAHVIIRGRDLYGKEVRFDRQFVMHGFRGIAESMATAREGPMTEREMERMREVGERWKDRHETLREMDRDGTSMGRKRAYSKEWKEQARTREDAGRSL